jgi:hypothetical protein
MTSVREKFAVRRSPIAWRSMSPSCALISLLKGWVIDSGGR